MWGSYGSRSYREEGYARGSRGEASYTRSDQDGDLYSAVCLETARRGNRDTISTKPGGPSAGARSRSSTIQSLGDHEDVKADGVRHLGGDGDSERERFPSSSPSDVLALRASGPTVIARP
jgi:hypothetical protein